MSEQILTQCTCGGAVHVYVKDGKIVRIRPIVFDETDAPLWTIEAKGKRFSETGYPGCVRIYGSRRRSPGLLAPVRILIVDLTQ